jgi:hypothetical protein
MRSTRLGTRLLKEKPGADDHGVGLSSFVVSLVLLVSAVTAAGNGPVEEMLAAARCEAAVRIRVRQWDGDLTGALLDPPAPTGLRSARVPTGAMGRWLRIVEDARRELVVDRITATRVDRLRFDEVCAATAHVVATQLPSPDAFGDSELQAWRVGGHASERQFDPSQGTRSTGGQIPRANWAWRWCRCWTRERTPAMQRRSHARGICPPVLRVPWEGSNWRSEA